MTCAGRSPEMIEDQVEYQVCRHSYELEGTARGAQRLVYGIDIPSPGAWSAASSLRFQVDY